MTPLCKHFAFDSISLSIKCINHACSPLCVLPLHKTENYYKSIWLIQAQNGKFLWGITVWQLLIKDTCIYKHMLFGTQQNKIAVAIILTKFGLGLCDITISLLHDITMPLPVMSAIDYIILPELATFMHFA